MLGRAFASLCTVWLLAGAGAQAQEPPAEDSVSIELSDAQADLEEQHAPGTIPDETDPHEEPDRGYYFAGLFYRHTFLPEFLVNLFLDDSFTANNPAFGAEITYRKDGFDIVGSLWYAAFAGTGPVRAAGDPEVDTEIIDSELKTIFISGAFLWSTPFNDVVSLQYGVDLGVGLVVGNLYRTEAYPEGDGWRKCPEPGANPAAYCDPTSVADGETGGHYGASARKWSDGGSVPNVLPWLGLPHLALRIKPVKQFMLRVDAGFGLTFFVGLAANYGF